MMPQTLEARLVTFLLGMVGAAFGVGVSWGVINGRLNAKAEVQALVAYETTNTQQHASITVRLNRIDEGVQTLRAIACDQAKRDSYCRVDGSAAVGKHVP